MEGHCITKYCFGTRLWCWLNWSQWEINGETHRKPNIPTSYDLWCVVFHFLVACLHQKSYFIDKLCFSVFLKIRWRNDPSLFKFLAENQEKAAILPSNNILKFGVCSDHKTCPHKKKTMGDLLRQLSWSPIMSFPLALHRFNSLVVDHCSSF